MGVLHAKRSVGPQKLQLENSTFGGTPRLQVVEPKAFNLSTPCKIPWRILTMGSIFNHSILADEIF